MAIFLFQNAIVGLNLAAFYCLVALGLTLMFGILGIVNMAHGVIYMLGAYSAYYLCIELGLNFYLAMPILMVALGLAGILTERVFYRPVGGRFAPFIVLTIALLLIIENAANLGFGVLAKGLPAPISGFLTIFGIRIATYRLAVVPIAAILVLGLYYLIYKTKIGLAMRVVEEDRVVAQLQGINVDHLNALVFFLGFALAAAAGALIAPIYALSPDMGGAPLLKAFMVIIIGGMGSVPGAILGSIVIGLADSFLAATIGSELAYLVTWVLVILVLIFKPGGFLGES